MPLPADLRSKIERSLRSFCERRVPEDVRDQVRLSFSVRGHSVELLEERPRWNNPSEWVSLKIAQFRFDPGSSKWSLHCRDRNQRWHYYSPLKSTRDFEALLAEVDRDPTGIFWG